jgi:hypothetical protein
MSGEWRSTGVLLPGSVQSAPAGAIGFDADAVLTADACQNFAAAGFGFVIRYLSLGPTEDDGDLSSREAERILQSGLALMAVQHVRDGGWIPSRDLGQEDGQNAAANARAIGLPQGVNIWLDLEGVRLDIPSSDVADHCNAWFGAVAAAGYVPGLYVGANAVLGGDQLYYDLEVGHYWKSGSDVPFVADRGYCMVQTISDRYVLDGRQYDRNVIQADNLGNTPVWLVADAQV